jgi:hypothetical protein
MSPRAKRRCQFQGGAGMEEKYRPKSPCLNEFEPSSPNQRNCDVCRPFARRAHNAVEANAKYQADPRKYAKRARENRWKQRKIAGRPCRRIGSMRRCEYRDKRGRRGEGCEIKYELRSSAQRYCDPCQLRADADRAQDYRDEHPEKEKARQKARWKTVREQLAKIKNGEFMPKPVSPGRPKLTPKETRAFEIGSAVEELIPKAEIALKIVAGLQPRERSSLEALRAQLLPLGFATEGDLRLAQFERTPKRLARSIVAGRNRPMTVEAVERSHQRYLRIRTAR